MDTDRLNNANPKTLVHALFMMLDTTTSYSKTDQMLAPAVLTLALADAYGLDPVKVMEVARNFLADRRAGQDTRMQALDLYIQRHIKK